MAIAAKVQQVIDGSGVRYDVVKHPESHSSSESAELAHIPGDRLPTAPSGPSRRSARPTG